MITKQNYTEHTACVWINVDSTLVNSTEVNFNKLIKNN